MAVADRALDLMLVLALLAQLSLCEHSTTAEEPESILKEDKVYWNELGRDDLKRALERKFNTNQAKNVIFFLGDGMGVSTVTAARIYAGQKAGKTGEENYLHFEKFPNVGLIKTYNVDKQVADSAGSATAYLTGVKGRYGTLGLDVSAPYNVCRSDLGEKPYVHSVLKWAQDSGRATGFVTTTRVTHATPAGLYAHTANRDWECDSQVPMEERGNCKDIARQLVEDEPGRSIQIILGGGRQPFEPATDNGATKFPCKRGDNRDLIQQWKDDKGKQSRSHLYLKDRHDLQKANLKETDYILGLFAPSHVPYELDRTNDSTSAPGIEEMTEAAIRFLKMKSDKGFFLLVEGGRIDHAHHKNLALKAMEEAVAMDRAVTLARQMTDERETLIVVTADHSHTFNINGYPVRGKAITGIAGKGENGYNYTTLSYSSGPGFWSNINNHTKEPAKPFLDASVLDIHDKNYKQVAITPDEDAYHGGEDVAVYATGPMSHLFYGVHEQNYVAHVMGYAASMGPYAGKLSGLPAPLTSGSAAAFVANLWVFLAVSFYRLATVLV